MKRVFLIILDGVGVGELPDAAAYGDSGSDTLGNLSRAVGGLELPTLARLGLGNLHDIAGVPPVSSPRAAYGRLREISAGKDSTTGHWELMGLITEQPFPTYPDGFPADLLADFCRVTGYDYIGNEPASGTEIIQRLGDEHVATGKLIVYTSADSVFQIAAHEEVVPLRELYRICEVTRELLTPPHQMSRVIARPFLGQSGSYERTPNRHDYSVAPPPGLLMPALVEAGLQVVTIGKIYDLYAGQGITEKYGSRSNADGMQRLLDLTRHTLADPVLYLLNLVDFDTLWGHRNDPAGMADGLRVFDQWFRGFLAEMQPDDLLLLTADHGNDPTTASTDHSREYVPLLACWGKRDLGVDLGTRDSFADVGATIADYFEISGWSVGESFWPALQTAVAGG
ncbi:MAG: phosphopentomutase [bacterium]